MGGRTGENVGHHFAVAFFLKPNTWHTLVVIPPFDQRGLLPYGIHLATWRELFAFFAGDARRTNLITQARKFALAELSSSFGTCSLFLAGSSFSDKPHPSDIESTLVINPTTYPMAAVPGLLLQAEHDRIKLQYEVDFYVSWDVPGANDFCEFFQYVGEKTGIAKNLNPKDRRGIIEVKAWTLG